MYIPIPRLPDVPKSAIFSSKLTWSVYSEMDIVAKTIGFLWPLGITSVSTIMSGLLSDMAINNSDTIDINWHMIVEAIDKLNVSKEVITFIWKLVNVGVQQVDI